MESRACRPRWCWIRHSRSRARRFSCKPHRAARITMSFILDALKKSEVERQRQAIPGLMDSRPLPQRAGFPLWAAALIALFVVNLLILAVVLTRHAPPATAPAPASPGSPAPAAMAPAATIA